MGIEEASNQIWGHVHITDDLGNVVLDEYNAIHVENISLAIAQSLGNKPGGPIEKMVFGNGGSTVSGVGTVTYLEPNVLGASATLYNKTFEKIVDNLNISNPEPSKNKIDISHVTGNLFSDLIITCTLDFGEPSGQDALDNANSVEDDFVFDEIGLVNYDGNLITHVIFSPVQKSLNRSFVINYTVRIQPV